MKCLYLILLLLFVSCRNNSRKEPVKTPDLIGTRIDSSMIAISNSDSLVLSTSREVLRLLKSKAFLRLSEMFHPLEGIRFSPYGFVDTTRDLVFHAVTFMESVRDKKKLYWGRYDGSGDSIWLTTAEYYNKFIYNADFLHAAKVSLNKRISSGNSLDNINLVYPGANFTEYYFPGFDKKYGGMDWTSLKLVFKFFKGKNYLVGIVHDQWTT